MIQVFFLCFVNVLMYEYMYDNIYILYCISANCGLRLRASKVRGRTEDCVLSTTASEVKEAFRQEASAMA